MSGIAQRRLSTGVAPQAFQDPADLGFSIGSLARVVLRYLTLRNGADLREHRAV
ncbi:hypothetical protein OH799_08220 [Nocardia sp. NBC_00881]|uniref:hypothetical protein n=1 Tax=Nocardia sp. NBC_00881 TaxID=2975995 RepID=UPI00386A0F8A|nr:hypothetical protein OH799_08220 [Nocardia sp. NBC_00881]